MGVTEVGRKLFVFVLIAIIYDNVNLFKQQADYFDWLI